MMRCRLARSALRCFSSSRRAAICPRIIPGQPNRHTDNPRTPPMAIDENSGSPRISELENPVIVPTIIPTPSGFLQGSINKRRRTYLGCRILTFYHREGFITVYSHLIEKIP